VPTKRHVYLQGGECDFYLNDLVSQRLLRSFLVSQHLLFHKLRYWSLPYKALLHRSNDSVLPLAREAHRSLDAVRKVGPSYHIQAEGGGFAIGDELWTVDSAPHSRERSGMRTMCRTITNG